jgi:hypothetical protein
MDLQSLVQNRVNAESAFSVVQTKNLNALSKLLDESEPGQHILKAEIARELGEFEQCLQLLFYQFDEDYGFVVGFIKKLAEAEVRAVKPFEQAKMKGRKLASDSTIARIVHCRDIAKWPTRTTAQIFLR